MVKFAWLSWHGEIIDAEDTLCLPKADGWRKDSQK